MRDDERDDDLDAQDDLAAPFADDDEVVEERATLPLAYAFRYPDGKWRDTVTSFRIPRIANMEVRSLL